jgi:hypothetical protein
MPVRKLIPRPKSNAAATKNILALKDQFAGRHRLKPAIASRFLLTEISVPARCQESNNLARKHL